MGKVKKCTYHVDISTSSGLNKRLEALLESLSDSTRGIRFADLFCGIGSFHIALRDAGCSCAYACDISKHATDFYSTNFQHVPDGNITEVDPQNISDFDILCAGFPCQSFSLMGKRKGLNDPRNGHMFDHLMRFVIEKRPSVVILENVEGILSAEGGGVMDYILESLKEASYRVTHRLLICNEFGIPQRRSRVFIVGIIKGVQVRKPMSDLLNVDGFKEKVTLSDFLRVPVVKKYANTIRIGGRSNTYSSKNWTQYLMTDDEMYQLTVEDGIRLQGYEGQIFEDSESQVWKLLGNTIPTVLSRLVVYSVISNVVFDSQVLTVDVPKIYAEEEEEEECNIVDDDDGPNRKCVGKGDKTDVSLMRFNGDYLDHLLKTASKQSIQEVKMWLRDRT